MPWNIYPKQIHGHTYYYAQRSWREKGAASAPAKAKGAGKSRVRTETVYLGSAETIITRLKKTRRPMEVRHREYGFVAAVYQTAVEIGLVDLLRTHIAGQRYGVPRWLYFMLPIINRLQHATSKQNMGKWATYKRTPQEVPAGIEASKQKSRYKDYLSVACQDGQPVFTERRNNIAEREKHFGKNLLFWV